VIVGIAVPISHSAASSYHASVPTRIGKTMDFHSIKKTAQEAAFAMPDD
jgi:hypothetical protein